MGRQRSPVHVFLLCVIIALVRTETSAVAVNSDVAETNTNTASSHNAEDKRVPPKPVDSNLQQSELHAAEKGPHTTGVLDDIHENSSPDKTRTEEGYRLGHSESVTKHEDKRFMKGIDQYLYAIQSNTRETENHDDTQAENQDFNFSSKQDESASLPFQNIDDTDKEGESESGSDVKDDEKRFIKGFESYLHKASGKRLADKRFMRGSEGYTKPRDKEDDGDTEEGFGSFPDEDKRFMRGFESYMKPGGGKRDDADTTQDFDDVAFNDKRFMRGFEGYMKPHGKTDASRGNIDSYRSSDKRFMKGFESYMQKPKSGNHGKREDGSNDEDSNDLDDKRFMKGFEIYLPKREPTESHAEDVNEADLQPVHTDKRFMKGVNWYIQQHSNDNLHSQRVKRSQDTSSDWYTDSDDNSGLVDKRFLKGINPYLQMYASSLPSKRFLKGINPYLLAYTGYPSKRFLKGIDPYLQIYASGRPSKRFMRIPSLQIGGRQRETRPRVIIRSGLDDLEEHDARPLETEDLGTDKRFMRGYEHYVRPKSKGRVASKRFMKGVNPYLHMYLHPLDDKKSDVGDADGGLRYKRFLKGINPYLQMYANRFQDSKRYGGGWYESSPEKRFMKGINPYLQMYASTHQELLAEAAEKRFIKGPLLDMYISRMQGKRVRRASKGNIADKRFLKGANPYLQMYSRNGAYGQPRSDKRFMKGIDGHLINYANRHQTEASSPDKRFLKGVEQYIRHYANHPRIKRDLHNRAGGSAADVSGTAEDITTEKRFLKGINPYLQVYSGLPGEKKNEVKKPVTDKRFMKGVNEYIHMYANRPEVKRDDDSDIPSDKRFMKGIDSYLRVYSKQAQGTRQDAGDAETSDIQENPPKRFMKGINAYLQNDVNSQTDKPFFKGVDPYLMDYASFQTPKRFMRGFEQYLHKPQPKRFIKGFHAYIQNYPSQPQGKRPTEKVSKKQKGDMSEANATKPEPNSVSGFADFASLQSPNDDKKLEKKFMQGVNHYIHLHDSQVRTKRQAHSFDEDEGDRTEWGRAELDLPPEKRFLKGVNSYLRHYANYERPTRSDYEDMETAIGDSLAVQLADTAEHMMNKRKHYRHNPYHATWPNTNAATWLWISGADLPSHDQDAGEDNKYDELDEDRFQPQRQAWRGPHQATVFDNSQPWLG